MEVQRMAKRFAIYQDKYRDLLRNVDPSESKVLTDTDGQPVQINLLNDYSSTKVKEEMSEFESSGTLCIVSICNGCHAGEQDNPKAVTSAVANILEKWDICYRKLKPNLKPDADSEVPLSEVYAKLNPCFSMEDIFTYEDASLDEISFIDTVIEGAEKIALHGYSLGKLLLQKGEMKKLCYVLASLVLTRNKVLFYNCRLVHKEGKREPFGASIRELTDMMDTITTQVVEYHNALINTVVIHDADSQDWRSGRVLAEGERISINIQFWCYHLQGLRADLFNILPAALAKKVLANAFNSSLSILTVRYCQMEPSAKRLSQYRADIFAILLMSHDMLLSLSPSLEHLFRPYPRYKIERSIHVKCTILLSALTFIGCPIKMLARVVEAEAAAAGTQAQPQPPPNRLQPLEKNREERLVQWLHLILPGIYAPNPERLSTPAFVFVLGRMAATQPRPDWAMVVRLCLSRGMEFPMLIIKNFGAFVPGMKGDDSGRRMRGGCGHYMCHKRCIGTADLYWPQIVASGILYIVMMGSDQKDSLVTILHPLLSRLSHSSWAALDKNVLWNAKRPIWFQGLVDLLEPFFIPAIDELLIDVESGRSWTLSHVPEAITKLLANLQDLAAVIPKSFYHLCEVIEALLPKDIRPVCDSVTVHLFVSCLYGLINKVVPEFREWKMQREKIDFLLAMGEKLCHLLPSESTDSLAKIRSVDWEAHQPQRRWDDSPEEFVNTLAEMVTDKILAQPSGQEAVKAVLRFIVYNSEWLQHVLGIRVGQADSGGGAAGSEAASAQLVPTPRLTPWEDEYFRRPQPKEMLSHISLMPMQQLLNYQVAWDECLKCSMKECNPAILLRLLQKRPENTDADLVDETDRALFNNVTQYLEQNILEKSVILDR